MTAYSSYDCEMSATTKGRPSVQVGLSFLSVHNIGRPALLVAIHTNQAHNQAIILSWSQRFIGDRVTLSVHNHTPIDMVE